MQQELTVAREREFSYPICFRDSFSDLAEILQKNGLDGRKICIVSDTNTHPLYAKAVEEALRKAAASVTELVLSAGEENKHLQTVETIYTHLTAHGFERRDLLLALGGGVVGDITGFAAATYLRGIDFLQVPTTLLSQVDSSIGGKTGVDFLQYKNMIGAFHQPRLVYMNLKTLDTLPNVQFACGMGEVLKTALIRDGEYYRWLLDHAEEISAHDLPVLAEMIRRCCEIKRDVVREDPKEQGVRAILNFGHTIGHAVEKKMNFSLPHGHCVALGMAAAARISVLRGMLGKEAFALVEQGIRRFDLPLCLEDVSAADLLQTSKKDKKMEAGKVKFVLLDGIGSAVIDRSLTDEELLEGIAYILKRGTAQDV